MKGTACHTHAVNLGACSLLCLVISPVWTLALPVSMSAPTNIRTMVSDRTTKRSSMASARNDNGRSSMPHYANDTGNRASFTLPFKRNLSTVIPQDLHTP